MVRMDWFISNLLGGVKLLVNSGDAEDAVTVLNQSIPENFDVQIPATALSKLPVSRCQL